MKLELPQVAEKVIEKIDEHDPEVLKISELFTLLEAQKSNIQNLKVAYGPHPITEQLKPLRKKRFMYAAAIVYRMKMIVREDLYPNSKDVIETRIKINSYLLNLSKIKNEEVVAEKIDQFFREIDEDEALETALSLYNLTADLNNLRNTHSSIKELLTKRAKQISARPRVKTSVLVQSIQKALRDMFKEIESAQLRNPLLDYTSLINSLNDLLDHYRMLINLRATINKRKAAGVEDGEGENQTPIEPEVNEDPTEGDV